ncbi:AaceriAER372Cp [[Ashbya] aceris (nom. inval.)]|nr:AaceriAER372Cp [[Ashbya] aceris (nom. inval.)]
MKVTSKLALSLAGCAVAAALPHAAQGGEDCTTPAGHQHKRAIAVEYVYETITVNGQGQTIFGTSSVQATTSSTSAPASSSTSTSSAESSSSSYSAPSSSSSYSAPSSSTRPSSSAPPSTTSAPPTTLKPSSSSEASSTTSSEASSSSSAAPSHGHGHGHGAGVFGDLELYAKPTKRFVDGVIPCSEFPEGQGVVKLDWLDFGGWSGIENHDTSTGGKCKEGSHCSYACQSGMSKTQWPSEQPEDGRSIGGLLCKNGFLHRTNKNTDYLCEWGVDKAEVVNKLDKVVSICRTDYPGTENMVIPTIVNPGKTMPLTVVDEDTYYKWRGLKTSAQYYVNDAGVSMEDGCIWSDEGTSVGNWAPMNFGAGYVDGIAYLSLIPNPNNRKPLNFNIKIVPADKQSVISGDCWYENGQYNGHGTDGCTVGVTKGKARFVLYK